MSESYVGYRIVPSEMEDVPIVQRNEHSIAPSSRSVLKSLKSPNKAGVQWLQVSNRSDYFMRYKITIIGVILSILVLSVFTVAIAYVALQSAGTYPWLHDDEIIGENLAAENTIFLTDDEPTIYKREEFIDRDIYTITSDHMANPRKQDIHMMQKRQAPERTGWRNDPFFTRLHRVETGRKVPREIETIRDTNEFFKTIHSYSDDNSGDGKREIGETEKMRVCKRSVERCKSVLESMQSLIKTTGDNVENLQQLMNQIRVNEDASDAYPQKYQALVQCIECKKMANGDSIKFVADAEEDESANYNHPVFQDRQSPMRNRLAIAEMLNGPISYTGDVTRRMIKETQAPSVINEIPGSSTESGIPDSGFQKTTEVSKSLNITNGTKVAYVIKNTTIMKQLSKADSPNGVSKAEDIQTEALTGPSAIFNVPGPENNWGWAEATRTQIMVEESPSASTSNPIRADPNEIRTSESISRSAHFDPRIVTGTHPAKGIYDGNSLLLPTAETMKTSQQVQYTPPIPWMPYPVCFYGPPTSGNSSPFKQTMPGTMPFSVSSPGGYPPLANQFPQRGFGFGGPPTGQGFGPTQYHREQGSQFGAGQQFPYGNSIAGYQPGPHMGPTAPGGQGLFPSFGNVPTGPGRSSYYCTYMPAPTYQLPSLPGVTEYQRSQESPHSVVTGREKPTDPKWSTQQINYSGFVDACPQNHQRCDDGSNCIPIESWCNGRVDCPDVSDETRCSCRDRVNKDRICDGYFDCPRGEDELGCFGCPVNYFSCKNWSENDGEGYCVPLAQRCDGLRQCPNGRDETDCSMLTDTYINSEDLFTVGFTVGYLHKNWQGRWYPVCTPTESWATEACLAETGFALSEPPRIRIESTPPRQYAVRYLTQSRIGEIKIVPTCYDKAVYVICPNLPCGTRVLSHQEKISTFGRNEDYFLASAKNTSISESVTSRVVDEMLGVSNGSNRIETTNGTDQEIVGAESRVVGGKPSQPKAWPFLVAIRKDGSFNCGGVIITEDWVLTAAHCIDGFTAHYYEIQAGVLRHHSFSPMAQSRRANYIKMHPSYQKDIMKNDLALIKVEEPLLFNRWVRPTCLPKSWPPENYPRREPLPDAACVTAGWGATYEHGPNPDHLREVEVPITRQCKHPEDRNDAEICAGIPQGGRDACQGDSGGPLMCTHRESKNQWYVAGIVSHGEGCGRPNEPGAYTRVSRFIDWMNNIIHSEENMMIGPKPRKLCPGFSCEGGLGKCLSAHERCNGVVDCLDAEDEMNCGNQAFANGKSKAQENRDYGDGKIVGQVTPGFRQESRIEKESSNDTQNRASIDTNGTGFTTVNDEIASSTTSTVDDSSEAVSMEVSRDPQPATTTTKPRSSSKSYFQLSHFTCTKLIQSLPISKRCNRVIDCEDGTDEDDCTCRDYLANVYQKAICNGHVDCHDGTDEENCTFCRSNEFTCSRSGTCIPQSKMCDRKADCDNMEDELDCFALTNGDHVIIDFDKRPHLNLEGVVTQWQNRTWRPVCSNHNDNDLAKMADQFCEYFGFGSAESAEKIRVSDSPIGVRESTKDFVHPYEYPPTLEIPRETADACSGFYLKCKPVLSANTSRLVVTNPLNDNIDYLWPWQASIFVNGRYHCPAILLEHSWLLATSRCVQNLDLTRNYTMALVGMAPTYLYVNGPYQQIVPIDSIKTVEKLDAALLHLGFPVNQTRHVQPIFVQKRIFPAVKTDVCVATGVDEKYRTGMTFLRPVPEPCPYCHRCYKNATSGDCKNETLTNWSGTIVCRGSDTWYPAAMFHEKDMLCGFQMAQTVASIDYGNAHFTEVMEDNIEPIVGPNCDGFRCPLGKCISWARVCDGIDDCRDRSDESVDYCRERKEQCGTSGGPDCRCSKSELRCANGQCVPKQAFCDLKVDCEDGSDETARCTCADYLRLTAPDRLCNNVRDCLDKSDESSEECTCNSVNFKCSGGINVTETCISQDFVCDGEIDCPNAEDEKICRAIQGRPEDPRGTGQILRRSFGMWHSECFATPVTTTKEASDICRSMNYNSGETLKMENAEDHYGPAMVPERDEFYMIRMNTRAWITLRHNRPLVSLAIARDNCHRAFLKCS